MSKKTKTTEVLEPVKTDTQVLTQENATEFPLFPFSSVKTEPNQGGYMIVYGSKVKVLQNVDETTINIYTLKVRTMDLFLERTYLDNPESVTNNMLPKHQMNCLKHAMFFVIDPNLSTKEVLASRLEGSIEYVSTILKKDLTFSY